MAIVSGWARFVAVAALSLTAVLIAAAGYLGLGGPEGEASAPRGPSPLGAGIINGKIVYTSVADSNLDGSRPDLYRSGHANTLICRR